MKKTTMTAEEAFRFMVASDEGRRAEKNPSAYPFQRCCVMYQVIFGSKTKSAKRCYTCNLKSSSTRR